jgi:hypothetical protein
MNLLDLSNESLPLAVEERIDALCGRFEDAWQAGQRPRLEDCLGQTEGLERQALLSELLRLERYYRVRAGETPSADEYRSRFPHWVEVVDLVLNADTTTDGGSGWQTVPPLVPGQTPLLAVPGYEVLGELGRGGMGVVFKARQAALNREVALKMILGGMHAGEDLRRRFLAEAEAVAALDHPGIVRIHDFGTWNDVPYFAMEFCSGGTLAGKLAGKPLPPGEAAALVEQLARAVQVAHDKGIIHRDLKPGNVFLAADDSPKVGDFGLARRREGRAGLTQTGAVLGTPSYMAPEQARAQKDVGPAADVYALGAILYECLTGRPPFLAATTHETLVQVTCDEPARVRQVNAKVPRDLETICLKCLSKEPGKRYTSAAELGADLHRFLEGRPILARPAGRLERLGRWCRREPVVAALLAAVLLLMVAGTATTTVLAVHARNAADEARTALREKEEAIRSQREGNKRFWAFIKRNPEVLKLPFPAVVARFQKDNPDVKIVRTTVAEVTEIAGPEAGGTSPASFSPNMFGD